MPSHVRPENPSGIERALQALADFTVRIPGARRVLLSPVIALPGYWFATAVGLLWGGLMSRFRLRSEGGVIVAPHMPKWSYGRGGTTVGAVYFTTSNTSQNVLEHESLHRAQWRRYGLCFIPLYIAAGVVARTNRFEVEAGLKKGGYA